MRIHRSSRIHFKLMCTQTTPRTLLINLDIHRSSKLYTSRRVNAEYFGQKIMKFPVRMYDIERFNFSHFFMKISEKMKNNWNFQK